MSSCTGNGDCLKQCFCICFDDEECEIESEVCSCGHRDHPKLIGGNTGCDIYCQSDCPYNCQLIECHNFSLCEQKLPQWVLNCRNGMCMHCSTMIGKIKFLNEKDDCPICLENKDMIQITCGKHNVCLDCWKKCSKMQKETDLCCPLCRESIWKWRKRR
jgi:hypothetical protein